MSTTIRTLRLFGVAVLSWTVTEDDAETSPGDCTTYPVGFTQPPRVPYEHEAPEHIED